jgi:hypothetical protein
MRHIANLSCLLAVLVLPVACGAEGTWTKGLPVVERAAQPQELLAYPEDGRPVAVNPPGFCWTAHDKARGYRLEVRNMNEGSRTAVSSERLTSTVCALRHALPLGNYFWQIVYLDGQDVPYGVSKTRSFSLSSGVPPLPMPDVTELKARLARVRPRLFLSGDRLREIREAVASGRVAQWKPFLEAANAAVEEQSYSEPAGYPKGEFTAAEWRRIYTPAKVGSAHLARTALAYRITGEAKYLDAARRWMMTLASWDPKGITSHRLRLKDGSEGNDEASMPMLERMAFGWDWMGDKLSPAERAKVLAAMTERGNQVLRKLYEEDFLSHPFNNHEGRSLAFLGDAGLSFLGDIPDAEKWLDYVIRCYLTSYPGWGGDQGGWAQGVSYWSAYVYWLTSFAEALRGVTEVDLFRRPFYRNTGYFAFYTHPPYAPRGAFGDGGYHPPSEAERMLIDYLADLYRNPVLKWHAQSIKVPQEPPGPERWREWFMEDVVAVLRAPRSSDRLEGRPPTTLDGSRLLADIGWAAMHSALGDAKNDVWVLFKASRFGSFSHSHGDQNTYQLNAYGRALVIDSGYYPWYGSPHDELWTRQTRAHNGVLVNGRGQPPHLWAADGQIEEFQRRGVLTIVRGQAANAYNLPQPAGLLRLWQQHLKEPVPPMEPKLESFERTLAFVASQTRPVLLVQDYLRTSAPATFDWLLHALNQMQADAQSGSITLQDGDVRLVVRLISTAPLRFSERSGFPVAPEFAENTAYLDGKPRFPDQWHLTAHTEAPSQEIKFLAVMVPYRATESAPEIVPLQSARARGFRVGGSEFAAWWGPGNRGAISLQGLEAEGRLVVRVTAGGQTVKAVSQ